MGLMAQHDILSAPGTTAPRAELPADFGDVARRVPGADFRLRRVRSRLAGENSLSGSDRVRWLNGMVTNNVRDLAPGSGVYAFLLNPQGHILGDLSRTTAAKPCWLTPIVRRSRKYWRCSTSTSSWMTWRSRISATS